MNHARLTGSGCPTVTDGLDRFRESNILLRRVGGGHPHFHPHTGGQKPNLTDPVPSAWEVCGVAARSSSDRGFHGHLKIPFYSLAHWKVHTKCLQPSNKVTDGPLKCANLRSILIN
jgi:hypothetical protein